MHTHMSDGTEPIADDEILYRRIPVDPEYYNREIDANPTPLAFRPTKGDTTGLSVYRAKYKSIEEAAENTRGKRYYVAVMRAADLRDHGIKILAKPIPNDPGHAEIPSLTYENRRTPAAREQQLLLAEKLCYRIEGPYP